eukprot:scaffold260_cov274-Pinguiococcus_pyrenoidosus.AAC.22
MEGGQPMIMQVVQRQRVQVHVLGDPQAAPQRLARPRSRVLRFDDVHLQRRVRRLQAHDLLHLLQFHGVVVRRIEQAVPDEAHAIVQVASQRIQDEAAMVSRAGGIHHPSDVLHLPDDVGRAPVRPRRERHQLQHVHHAGLLLVQAPAVAHQAEAAQVAEGVARHHPQPAIQSGQARLQLLSRRRNGVLHLRGKDHIRPQPLQGRRRHISLPQARLLRPKLAGSLNDGQILLLLSREEAQAPPAAQLLPQPQTAAAAHGPTCAARGNSRAV